MKRALKGEVIGHSYWQVIFPNSNPGQDEHGERLGCDRKDGNADRKLARRHTGKPQTHQYPNTHVSQHRNSWSIICFATWQASVGIIIPSNPSILIFKYPNILVSSYLDIKLPKCLPCNHSDILALWKVYNVHWTFGWKSHLTRCRLPSVHFLIRDSHSKAHLTALSDLSKICQSWPTRPCIWRTSVDSLNVSKLTLVRQVRYANACPAATPGDRARSNLLHRPRICILGPEVIHVIWCPTVVQCVCASWPWYALAFQLLSYL